MGLKIINGRVVTPGGIIEPGEVYIAEGKITSVGPMVKSASNPDELLDAGGAIVGPGFIDIHCHGYRGWDIMDGEAEALRELGKFLVSTGTTAWVATGMTGTFEKLHRLARATAEVSLEILPDSAGLLGLHLEGPYINPDMAGYQDSACIRPFDIGELTNLRDTAKGSLKRITLAPECLSSLADIEKIMDLGIVTSIGHSLAKYELVKAAAEKNCRVATHLFNAMGGLDHRDPGTAGAVLDLPEFRGELIADGIHVHPALLRLAFRAKGALNLGLITDAHPAAGLPKGDYPELGVRVTEEAVYNLSGTLAGSILTMADAARYMMKFTGATLEEVFQMASGTPAEIMGVRESKGALEEGMDADIVIVDEDFRIVETIVRGEPVFRG